MERSEVVEKIAQRIAIMEGYFIAPTAFGGQLGKNKVSLAFKNANPGNLRKWGTRPIDKQGYVVFQGADQKPDHDAGWTALRKQVAKNIDRELTFLEFFGGRPGVYPGFSPAADMNNPKQYATFVAKVFGVAPTVRIKSLISQDTQES